MKINLRNFDFFNLLKMPNVVGVCPGCGVETTIRLREMKLHE